MSCVTQEERDELAQTGPGLPAGCESAFGLCQGPGIGTLSSLLSQLPFLHSDQNKNFSVKKLELLEVLDFQNDVAGSVDPHPPFQTCHSDPGVGRSSHHSVCKSQTLTHPHSLL